MKWNQRGQISIEIVLMTALVVLVAVTVTSTFRNNQLFAKLVGGPWQATAGMIQNGVWGPADNSTKHPSHFGRVRTPKGNPFEQP